LCGKNDSLYGRSTRCGDGYNNTEDQKKIKLYIYFLFLRDFGPIESFVMGLLGTTGPFFTVLLLFFSFEATAGFRVALSVPVEDGIEFEGDCFETGEFPLRLSTTFYKN
jgi:hypothetical protein